MDIVLASHNAGKIAECKAILAEAPWTLRSQAEFQITTIPETGQTFIENAILKARHAAQVSSLPALADDSGLVVDALQGAPGVYSARYAGIGATAAENNAKLLYALEGVPLPQRTASFVCVVCYLQHAFDPTPILGFGRWFGHITVTPRGQQGFGYDPLFQPRHFQQTVAELTPADKQAHSHRAQALQDVWQQYQRVAKQGA